MDDLKNESSDSRNWYLEYFPMTLNAEYSMLQGSDRVDPTRSPGILPSRKPLSWWQLSSCCVSHSLLALPTAPSSSLFFAVPLVLFVDAGHREQVRRRGAEHPGSLIGIIVVFKQRAIRSVIFRGFDPVSRDDAG